MSCMQSNLTMKKYIQKANICSKETNTKSSWIIKNALQYTDDYADVII
jgi:hypothetical protein